MDLDILNDLDQLTRQATEELNKEATEHKEEIISTTEKKRLSTNLDNSKKPSKTKTTKKETEKDDEKTTKITKTKTTKKEAKSKEENAENKIKPKKTGGLLKKTSKLHSTERQSETKETKEKSSKEIKPTKKDKEDKEKESAAPKKTTQKESKESSTKLKKDTKLKIEQKESSTKLKKETKKKSKKTEVSSEESKEKEEKEHSTQSEESSTKNDTEKKPKKTRIVLSGFDFENKDNQFKKRVKELNQFIIKNDWENVDLLVIKKSMRTEKTLEALVRNIPIVNEQYIEAYEDNQNPTIDEYSLIEAFPGLQIERSKRKKIFAGKTIALFGTMKISTSTIARWIESCGGEIKMRAKDADIVIVGKTKGLSGINGKKGDAVLVEETWLYDCLSEMKFIDFGTHKISVDQIEKDLKKMKEERKEKQMENDEIDVPEEEDMKEEEEEEFKEEMIEEEEMEMDEEMKEEDDDE